MNSVVKYEGVLWMTLQFITTCINCIEWIVVYLHNFSMIFNLKFLKKFYKTKSCNLPLLTTDVIKQPLHIALIVAEDDTHLTDLANIITWSYKLGSRVVTVHTNSDSNNVSLLFSCAKFGRRKVVELARNISNQVQNKRIKYQEVNYEMMESSVETLGSESVKIPEPQLAIVFGNYVCLHGFHVWNVRLTEILHIPTHKSLTQLEYLKIIKKYSKCQQRFGT